VPLAFREALASFYAAGSSRRHFLSEGVVSLGLRGEHPTWETVLIIGASGAVGRAAAQIAHWKKAKVIGAGTSSAAPEADVLGLPYTSLMGKPCNEPDHHLFAI
jgi:NADPH:quinone reductase-like Zn-dependent oxidoreductase